jgi:hypothetical protein
LDFAEAVRALGYDLLFADLYSPTSRSPLGDRLYDELKPVLRVAGIAGKGVALHSMRHGFGNNLKQERVTLEERADLLGHAGSGETGERYCDAYDIGQLHGTILKLPIVTDHLAPRPIQLLPWVRERREPPFSQAARSRNVKQEREFGSARTRPVGKVTTIEARCGRRDDNQ